MIDILLLLCYIDSREEFWDEYDILCDFLGTLYLKGKIEKKENTIDFSIPNTILGFIPFGMNH